MMNKDSRSLLIALALILPMVIVIFAVNSGKGWRFATMNDVYEDVIDQNAAIPLDELQDTKAIDSANMVVSVEEASRIYTIDYMISLSKHIIKGEVVHRNEFGEISEFDVRVIEDYGNNIEYIKDDMIKIYASRRQLEEGKTYYMFLKSMEYDWFPNRLYHVADYKLSFVEVESKVSAFFMESKDTDAYKSEVLLSEEMFVEKLINFSAPKDLSSPYDRVMLTDDEMNMEQAVEAADVCAIGKVVRVRHPDKYSDKYSIVLTQALKGDMILYSEDDAQLMIESKYESWFQRVNIYTRAGVAEVGDEIILLLKKVDESAYPYKTFSVYSFLPRGDETADMIEKIIAEKC